MAPKIPRTTTASRTRRAVAPRTKRAVSPLSATSRARFRRALEEQRDAQLARLAAIERTAYASDRLAGDQHVMMARLEAMRRILADSEHALMRIDNGTYGVCERCSAEIPPARLEIRPHARFCVGCQHHQDSRAA